jgi:plasmid stabilization system protein ParE
MVKYNVVWVDLAKKDLYDIIDFISLDKKDVAKKIYNKLKEKAKSLELMPKKGRIIPELENYNIDLYREIIENPWRIIYRIDNQEVIILAIIDGRRNVEDIIFERIIKKEF